VSRFLAINIEGKIGELTGRRTSSFINSVEQHQTLPKTQPEIDISPFLKTQEPSILYSIILKVNNSGAAKVEYLTKKK
jgi:hypothetical protein